MPTGAPSAQKIIDAWCSVADVWTVRRDKSRAHLGQWEVLHTWGDQTVIDPSTQKVVARFHDQREAHKMAEDLELLARARAVQCMIVEWNV